MGFIIGAVFFYLGARRAKKQTARLKLPTTWDYVNQAAGYWLVGLFLIIASVVNVFRMLGFLTW